MKKLTVIKGGRAQLEMDVLLKIAEPKIHTDSELKQILEPLEPRATTLSVAKDSNAPPVPHQSNEAEL